jgi:peptide/nickel transport system substrate-binding protein
MPRPAEHHYRNLGRHPSSRRHSPVFSLPLWLFASLLPFLLVSCHRAPSSDSSTLVFLIESSPTNLDPRIATDAQSERLHGLLFSSLVEHDDQLVIRGDLAERWETPDPLTYNFHLRPGVRFHDGRPLTSADVKFTFDSILSGAVSTPKRGTYRMVASVEAPDEATVVFHLKEPYASLLWELSRPGIGIVPRGSGADFAAHPIGSGPFRFVRASQEEDVVLERNPDYFRGAPTLARVRFRIVPDAIVRALELRNGSADIEMSSLSADMVRVLGRQPALEVTERPGTNYSYLGVNLEDPLLARREVRQALAYATDRNAIIQYLLRGQAHPASGILPPNHWAYEPAVRQYPYDPARAEQLLDAAGFPRRADGMRFKLTLKTSTDEFPRLLGATLQEQWRGVGIELELRPLELATLLADVNRGNFQLCSLRWVGGNLDPDIFEFVFSSHRFPPDGANRGHYRNPELDALVDQIRVEGNPERRKVLCSRVQKILAEDLPYINLWFNDVICVHRRGLGPLRLSPTGDYDFLASP